jgi:undecaprenyl diphosphate synthase
LTLRSILLNLTSFLQSSELEMNTMDYRDKIEEIKLNLDLPRHIGVIMDGNGRWAKKRGLSRLAGHSEGVNSTYEIVEICGELGIEVLTIYTFSEENWKRPDWEVSALMKLLVATINKYVEQLDKKNVRIRVIGQLNKLPEAAQQTMLSAIERTKHNIGLILNVALSYGGRQEIISAVKSLITKVQSGDLSFEDINEWTLSNELYTAEQPDPDLIIRTGGEYRISNFLLWQIAYAELYITNVCWPEFRKSHFIDALWEYGNRERRFGKVSEQIKPEYVF